MYKCYCAIEVYLCQSVIGVEEEKEKFQFSSLVHDINLSVLKNVSMKVLRSGELRPWCIDSELWYNPLIIEGIFNGNSQEEQKSKV